jgi:hypothetical protein
MNHKFSLERETPILESAAASGKYLSSGKSSPLDSVTLLERLAET